MSIEKTIFGTTKDGREVTAYTLRNIRGMRVKISSLGAAIVSVEMKDFAGERKDIVLGYDKAPDLCWMGQSITCRKMRERITCTVDRTVMRSASGIV